MKYPAKQHVSQNLSESRGQTKEDCNALHMEVRDRTFIAVQTYLVS